MLIISYADFSGLSPAILAQFTFEMCAATKNREINTKALFLKAQDHSGSLTLIQLKSLSPVLVMISSKSVSICNRFHAGRANSGKITTVWGVPLFTLES